MTTVHGELGSGSGLRNTAGLLASELLYVTHLGELHLHMTVLKHLTTSAF